MSSRWVLLVSLQHPHPTYVHTHMPLPQVLHMPRLQYPAERFPAGEGAAHGNSPLCQLVQLTCEQRSHHMQAWKVGRGQEPWWATPELTLQR